MQDYKADTASNTHNILSSKRSVIIKKHGENPAVLIDLSDFDAMSQRLEVLEDITMSESMIAEGKGIPHAKAKEMILKRIS